MLRRDRLRGLFRGSRPRTGSLASERVDPRRVARHAARRPLSNPENIVPRRRYRVAGRPVGRSIVRSFVRFIFIGDATRYRRRRRCRRRKIDIYPRRIQSSGESPSPRSSRGRSGTADMFSHGRAGSTPAAPFPEDARTNRSSKIHANATARRSSRYRKQRMTTGRDERERADTGRRSRVS